MPMTSGHNYYPTSVADMRDVYGLVDNASTPPSSARSNTSARVSESPRSSSTSSSSSFSFSRMLRKKGRVDVDTSKTPVSAPTPTPSSSSRSSMDSQRTLTTPSSTLSASKPKPMEVPRDYEAAFGALSSSYGFNGSAPTSVPVVPTVTSTTTRSSHRKAAPSQSSPSDADEQRSHARMAWAVMRN